MSGQTGLDGDRKGAAGRRNAAPRREELFATVAVGAEFHRRSGIEYIMRIEDRQIDMVVPGTSCGDALKAGGKRKGAATLSNMVPRGPSMFGHGDCTSLAYDIHTTSVRH